jgi:glycerol-3-phosphate dehydrogenase
MVSSKPQPPSHSKVLVLGAGNFGSCLASHLGDSQHDVWVWARELEIVKHFNEHHRNPVYLPTHDFPKNITAIGPGLPDKEFMDSMDVLLFAIPTQFLRWVVVLPLMLFGVVLISCTDVILNTFAQSWILIIYPS